MDAARFEWDAAKDFENVFKHGVSFLEAQAAFADERRVLWKTLPIALASRAITAWAALAKGS